MRLKGCFIGLLCLVALVSTGQNMLHGYVIDEATGERLIGANVYVPSTGRGCVTNEQGHYSLPLPQDSVEIITKMLGYERKVTRLKIFQDTQLDFELTFNSILEEVTVTAAVEVDAISSTEMSVNKISGKTIQRSTMLLGEPDILKSLQLLPGVKSGNEGFAGLFIRGGTPDQNLILMDGVPVYNVNHLFGFLSTFNADVVRDVKLYKGGIPARYGGRLSSVIDISLKEGNRRNPGGGFSLSPLSGHFFLEGPVKKNKSSYILSFRKSWLDVLTRIFVHNGQQVTYNFYDLNFKYTHSLNQRTNVTMAIYSGNDKFKTTYVSGEDKSSYSYLWNNLTFSVRMNHIFSSKLFGTTTFYRSNYKFDQQSKLESPSLGQSWSVKSTINDWSIQQDFEFDAHRRFSVRYGGKASWLGIAPEVQQIVGILLDTTLNKTNVQRTPVADAYGEVEVKLGQKVSANIGLRESVFFIPENPSHILQPRASMVFLTGKSSSVKISYNRSGQFFHLLTNSSLSLPTDLWVPSTANVHPEVSDQVAAGYNRRLPVHNIEFSFEAYYKRMLNLTEYKDGSNYLYGLSNSWEDKVTTGNGRSYGIEAFLNKQRGTWTGWISYCLSFTDRQFSDINYGERFPFRYDRRHDISIFSDLKIAKRKSLSAVFALNSGNWITLPVASYAGVLPPNYELTRRFQSGAFKADYRSQELIDRRNNYKLPPYHRLDLNFETWKMTKRNNKRYWIFSIYNVYARMNPFLVYESQGSIKKLVVFPIVPSVCYKLEF